MASSSNTSSSSSSSSAAGGGYGAPLYSAPGGGVGGTGGGAGGAGQGSSSGPAGPSPGNKYQCPNCGKAFSRDDLLRRHLAREARAMAQPQFDRQKSCFECARSKARCDLEVPSCGRCRARGKHCVYGARSGNPNVRRQRDSANPPANLAGMTIATGPHHGDMGVGPSGGSPFAWAPGGDAAYYSDSSHGSIPTTPGSIHSGDESSSDSGAGWADASQVPYGGPRTHGYTASSASLPMQPSVGPYAGVPGPIPGPSHGIPQGMGASVDQAPVVTPTTYMTRHSHDPSMPSGGRLITDLDRSAPAYKTEDGEETPIGRIVSSFAAGPSSMSARAPEPDFDPRSRSVMGPPTHLPSHPQHHPHQQHPMMQQQQHAGPSHHFQQQQHQPHQPHALPHGAHSSHQQQQLPPSGWIPPPQNPYAPMSSSPLHHHHAGGGGQLMGPPLGLPHRSTASLGPTSSSGSDGSAAGHFASPTRSRSQQRPQPHRLLTGAAMPQPPPAMGGNNAGAGGMHMPPPSGKPLFSAMVDLSGWLEDPVVPSPLYPTGPSMAPFAPSGAEPGASGSIVSGDVTAQQQQQQPQASLDTMMQSDDDSQQQQQSQQQQPDATSQSSSQMPASRYWWAHPPSQSDYTLMQGVAQASANHLSHYPALMVLPEPSSPVPPTVHRPWMAMMRGAIPPYLAIARVVLAGYAVRLPASEAVVWESVGRETRRIVECHEAICSRATSDLDVFGATQSLFFYCILLMMCNDAGAVGHVDVALTNSAFFGLSQLAKTLSGRVQVAQQQQQAQHQQGGDSKAGTADEWMGWGFVETMRRTVWAAYAMLVLQRYRDSADMSQGRLAGVDLILDLELPAPALEFEAGTLEDWNKARAALYGGGQTEEGEGAAVETGNNGNGRSINRPTLTFRDLLRYRPSSSSSSSTGNGIDTTTASNVDAAATQGSSVDPTPPTTSSSSSSSAAGGAPKELLDYFERHDAFVATVLSIAFCLDASLTAA